MVLSDYSSLVPLIGGPRLARYRERYRGDESLALKQYTWNLAVSSALWSPIAVFEVVLRNALHDRLREAVDQEDWWNSDRVHLCDSESGKITEALEKLSREGNYEPSADDIVAATSLGLWVGLLTAGINRDPRLGYQYRMWEPRLKSAFPHRREKGRREIWGLANDVRKIRNRIAHHEPIWHQNVELVLEKLEGILACIDPAAAEYVRDCERVRHLCNVREEYFTDPEKCVF